ncbi:UPF0203-domain-containing protein [Polychaeton citri CBS 116435]|uniref:UPF0203-domain-containing protein n=1 Tax=Polychaeton citri CBS 116435 TaxID=1314669 RepID=A0A9P4PYN0_9PEZI|nr:UPF0203-domain-containing protein [Polychaeton citri CBS 116435]
MSSSLSEECNQAKERYDSCFLKWYSEKFLRGTATTDECDPLFKEYRVCLGKALKDRGIDKMIEEARADHKEQDIEYMKPSGSVTRSEIQNLRLRSNRYARQTWQITPLRIPYSRTHGDSSSSPTTSRCLLGESTG